MQKCEKNDARHWQAAALCIALGAMTFAVFGQTLRHEFINFDDDQYVYENPVVVRGLTGQGMFWAFRQAHCCNWHPLTWISHMLDCQLYGLNPGGHHLTNVRLHVATVMALFLVLRSMTGAFWRSAFVAAVFAIHPLRVESVAWVAERKDVLSGLFFMLTLGAYARYARGPRSRARYGLVMLLFALGLMCKPMLVTLPLVLLLLDFWPLQRVESFGKLMLEKAPLLALSTAACLATLLAQHGAIQSEGSFSLTDRLGNALTAGVVYLRQMVWPEGLAAFYPYPLHALPAWEVALAGVLLAGFSAVAWWQRHKQPWLLSGWLWYLLMLLPVAGIIQVGGQAHADRYTYLPQIGIYVALTWLAGQWAGSRAAAGVLMAGVLTVLGFCAWKQTAFWHDSETLWNHALACTVDNDVARNSLGRALLQKGQADEAISCFQEALQINPGYAPAHVSLGNALLQTGRLDAAIAHYQSALQIEANDPEVQGNLGIAFFQKGKVDEAILCFQKALRIKPDYSAHNNLGIALLQKGKVDEAIAQYQQALEINSDYAEAHNNLGNALLQKGKVDEAITQFQKALRINATFAKAHNNLGKALLQKGEVDEAILHCQRALQVSSNYADAHINLGNALLQKGQVSEAMPHFREALRIAPGDPNVLNDLAWLLATCPVASLRNGDKAVELAERANKLAGGENPRFLRTMAAAFAEAGRFGDAVRSAHRAIEVAQAAGQKDLAALTTNELKDYEAGLAFHR